MCKSLCVKERKRERVHVRACIDCVFCASYCFCLKAYMCISESVQAISNN